MAWEGSSRSKRLPKDWEKRRRFVLTRDPMCRTCKQSPAVEVDHIKNNDDHRIANLQGLCKPCHKDKTDREKNRIHYDRTRPRAKHPGLRGGG